MISNRRMQNIERKVNLNGRIRDLKQFESFLGTTEVIRVDASFDVWVIFVWCIVQNCLHFCHMLYSFSNSSYKLFLDSFESDCNNSSPVLHQSYVNNSVFLADNSQTLIFLAYVESQCCFRRRRNLWQLQVKNPWFVGGCGTEIRKVCWSKWLEQTNCLSETILGKKTECHLWCRGKVEAVFDWPFHLNQLKYF